MPNFFRLAAFLFAAAAFAQSHKPLVEYGSNPAAGRTFTHDGVKLYYEVYGTREGLLLIHGNGGSIAPLGPKIDFFRNRYRVIAMDSRDHGKSGDSPDSITYEKMTGDLAALLDHLKSPPVNVLGISDGAIEALLLGIQYPGKVKKIAAMAANLRPEGLHPEALAMVRSMMETLTSAKDTPEVKRKLKVTRMMLDEPHIDPESLSAITAPTLVLAGDRDMVLDEHTLEIYGHLRNSQLCIFPNGTHLVHYDDARLFNSIVGRFFREPFAKKDRINDMLKSLEALRGSKH